MKKRHLAVLLISHGLVAAAGFAAGIYALPILVAPEAPDTSALADMASSATYRGEFRRDLQDSDALHWGEGQVAVSDASISFIGRLSPGPDYKLYLSPEFVETEADFERLKPQMVRVGDVRSFNNFLVTVPPGVDPSRYKSVIIWCEAFGEFITAAQYQ